MPGIGQNGHITICAFANGGKSNPSGKLDYHGSIAHTNPMQLVDALKGLNYFFRWNMLGNSFPDFTQPSNCYNVLSLRRDTDETNSINYRLLNDKYHLLYDVIGFRHRKKGKLHQN